MVTERNWLLVFPWATWGGNANLPHFVEGIQFTPTEVRAHAAAAAACSADSMPLTPGCATLMRHDMQQAWTQACSNLQMSIHMSM